jgi:hypothetical protein
MKEESFPADFEATTEKVLFDSMEANNTITTEPIEETSLPLKEEVLKRIEQNAASQEVKIVRNKAEFKATKSRTN